MVFRKRENLAAILAGAVLVGYIGFLLIANYRSQVELRKSAFSRLIQDLERRAAAVNYFSSERVNDIKALAAGNELTFFFTNKALGMSMKYGLSANLQDIGASFDRLIREKKLGQDRIYDRIDFVGAEEDMHIYRASEHAPRMTAAGLKAFLNPEEKEIRTTLYTDKSGSDMVISLPYRFKGRYMGQIITWVCIDAVYKHLIQTAEGVSKRTIYVADTDQYVPLASYGSFFPDRSDLPEANAIPLKTAYRYATTGNVGSRADMLALRVPVADTPLYLVAVMPQSEVFGPAELWRLFLVLGVISVIVVISIGALLRFKDQNLILGIRLDESKKRQHQIAEKNIRLSEEIAERKEVETALRASENALKRAKDAAEAASRTKSEFLANMSHELRTPLNHIIGFTELVAYKHFGDLNSDQEEYLSDALKSSRLLLSLINDILDISKVEAGKIELDVSEVNLRALLENSLTMIKEKAIAKHLTVSADIGDIPTVLSVDERRVKQILYNLLSNAAKFTPGGGSIQLRACCRTSPNGFIVTGSGGRIEWPLVNGGSENQPRRSYLEIAVQDTGIGIKKEDLERIFDPFEQADGSTTRKFEGTGLGLSLSQSLAALHGGLIWAESAGQGAGSTFYVVLPIAAESLEPIRH